MSYFLAVTHTYEAVDVALCKGGIVISVACVTKFDASRDLIIKIDALLKNESIQLSDVSFIAANIGPGPFSTLRTVITTVNGIGFATKIPLIGVPGLQAFVDEYADVSYPVTIVLLNAFSFDVYYAVQSGSSSTIRTGCMNVDLLLTELRGKFADARVRFLGQGAELYRENIRNVFGDRGYLPDPLPFAVSGQQIAQLAFQMWQQGAGGEYQLTPLYLKQFTPVV